ncbi:hypothetical protein TIFTF001_003524 [Ficus carica]|uniref:Uncharacterized protein n=1 Tax=Ficus carica TaxID=3494 RepID=A0AA88CUC3_FICCA|nr:hypothetical protein TIFTF001_003524 [Ficus carica]
MTHGELAMPSPSRAFSQPLRVDGIGSCELGGPLRRSATRVADDAQRCDACDARGGSGFGWSVAHWGGSRGGGSPSPGGLGPVATAGSTGSPSGEGGRGAL